MSRFCIDRRTALAVPITILTCGTAKAACNSTSAEETLRRFLTAFENCDLAAMEAAFDSDATYFDRASPDSDGQVGHYRRGRGMPAGMRKLVIELPRTKAGPPYLTIEPQNLLVQKGADIAVCSFHLIDPNSLGRRTVILQRRKNGWKIIPIHASTVSTRR